MFLLYLLNEKKRNSFHPVRWSAEIRFLLIIIGFGESGEAILNEIIVYDEKQFQLDDSML